MVFVAVGENHCVDPVGVLAKVGEVGKDEVDAGHVRVGEHDAHVENENAAVHLDAGAVPAYLPEAAEKYHPDRSCACPVGAAPLLAAFGC